MKHGVHSFMMVPLLARGTVLGLATFYRCTTPEPFGDEDTALATELAARAAVCVDNARLYHREHDTALILQRSMLPQHITPPPASRSPTVTCPPVTSTRSAATGTT